MIIVTTEVDLTSSQPLHSSDTPDFVELIADHLFEVSNSDPEDVSSNYETMLVTVSITSEKQNFDLAVAESVVAIEAALKNATAQMPWVEAKIRSIQARELTAA